MSETQAQSSSESHQKTEQHQSYQPHPFNSTHTVTPKNVPEQMTLDVAPETNLLEDATITADAEMQDLWQTVDLPGTVEFGNGAVETKRESVARDEVRDRDAGEMRNKGARAMQETEVTKTDSSQSTAEVLTEKSAATAKSITAERESELLNLIHDLNECNDVLLARVSQLESELESSQQALESESSQAKLTQNKMAEQLSAQQLSAQTAAQNAQQQIAKVIDQLEDTEQQLQRQKLMHETLQSELANAQERINQLEHEAALSAQQHAAEAQARVQAETTNRDLRSRLQRQQRYTLQFKAALEKSLTVTTTRSNQALGNYATVDSATHSQHYQGSNVNAIAQPISSQESNGVTMPKAQRIMPWAGGSSTAAFDGIDPHLENLIRNASQPLSRDSAHYTDYSQTTTASSDTDSASANPTPANPTPTDLASSADPEAEVKLWQDLERVMDDAADPAEAEPVTETTAQETTSATDKESNNAPGIILDSDSNLESGIDLTSLEAIDATIETPTTEALVPAEASTTEPSSAEPTLNWRDNLKLTTADAEQPTHSTTNIEPVTQASEIAPTVIPTTAQSAASQLPTATNLSNNDNSQEISFTEPSPWGDQPLTQAETPSPAISNPDAVSPIVDRLRSQKNVQQKNTQKKKVSPFSSIQLPTFATAKAGSSFKR